MEIVEIEDKPTNHSQKKPKSWVSIMESWIIRKGEKMDEWNVSLGIFFL